MITTWMLYAIVVATALGVAALLVERALLRLARATRFVWFAALAASLAWPVIASQLDSAVERQRVRALVAIANPASAATPSPLAWPAAPSIGSTQSIDVDAWAVRAWIALSASALAWYALAWLGLRRRLRDARVATLAGARVYVTRDAGPAVVGFWRPRVIVPRWLCDVPQATQALVVAHEREHLAASDSRLFALSALSLVLVPWNVPLWWQLRRLRIAIEIDCDARVLRTCDRRSYGAALVEIASRTIGLRAAAAGLGASGSALERRVRIMQALPGSHARLVAALLGTVAVAVIAVAADVQPPAGPYVAGAAEVDERGVPILPSPIAELNSSQAAMAQALVQLYPQLASVRYMGQPVVSALLNEYGSVARSHLEIMPSQQAPDFSGAYWQSLLARFEVSEGFITQQIVTEVPVGPNRVAVAWITKPGASVADRNAPRLDLTPAESRGVTEARILAQVTAHRTVIERFAPDALEQGVPNGQELWFLMDPDGRVLRSGKRLRITNPEEARTSLEALFPGIKVAYVVRGTGAKDRRGVRLPVTWHWLERGSAAPSAPRAI